MCNNPIHIRNSFDIYNTCVYKIKNNASNALYCAWRWSIPDINSNNIWIMKTKNVSWGTEFNDIANFGLYMPYFQYQMWFRGFSDLERVNNKRLGNYLKAPQSKHGSTCCCDINVASNNGKLIVTIPFSMKEELLGWSATFSAFTGGYLTTIITKHVQRTYFVPNRLLLEQVV